LEAAIMLLEYLTEYAEGTPVEDWLDLPPDEIKAMVAKVDEIRSRNPIQWTDEDFIRLICSGGFELHDGRLVPRL
jgi:hypothetical protein